MASVLVVEDDTAIANLVAIYLRREGHDVQILHDGAVALRQLESTAPPPDLVVLDLMLPGLDGRGVARRIRSASDLPIIMLTALDDARDKVEGLDIGADDYLTKPFDPDELLARVRAILRRTQRNAAPASQVERIAVENVTIEPAARRVIVNGSEVGLRTKEFDLLLAMMRHSGQVLSRDQLLDLVWGGSFEGDTRTVDVTISRLRERLAELGAKIVIETLRSVGYRLDPKP